MNSFLGGAEGPIAFASRDGARSKRTHNPGFPLPDPFWRLNGSIKPRAEANGLDKEYRLASDTLSASHAWALAPTRLRHTGAFMQPGLLAS